MSDELKACPFCGKEATTLEDDGITFVQCGYDECPSLAWLTVEEWNTRPIEDALRAENARLREELMNVVSIITGSQKGYFGEVLTYMPHFAERYVDTLIKFLYHAGGG